MVVTFKSKTWLDERGVAEAVRKATIEPLDRAAHLVEQEAKRLLNVGGGSDHEPSAPGDPPHTQTGNLKDSIAWARKGWTRIIGPTLQAWYGRIHEFGGWTRVTAKSRAFFWWMFSQTGNQRWKAMALSKKKRFVIPARPFMRPALANTRRRFAKLFESLNIRRHYRDRGQP